MAQLLIRQDGLAESIEILSNEMNARLSQEMDSLMNLMQTQIIRAISSAIDDRVLPGIHNIMSSLPLDQNVTETTTSPMSEVSVTFGKTRIQKVQRRTQGPHVIFWKIRTLRLTPVDRSFSTIRCNFCSFFQKNVRIQKIFTTTGLIHTQPFFKGAWVAQGKTPKDTNSM